MRILIGLVFLISTSVASAQVVFSPSFSYITEEIDTGTGTPSEFNLSFFDFRLGYLHPSGLYLGGMYSMNSRGDENDSFKGYGIGPTVGFSHYSGFFALFTYYLMAEQEIAASTTYTDGMGPQIDIGWAFPITAMFHIGPQLTYRSITFDKLDTSGVETTADTSFSYMMPALNLWFNF